VKFQRRSSEDLLASLFSSDSHCQRWYNRKQDGDETDAVAPDYGQPSGPLTDGSGASSKLAENSSSSIKERATDPSGRLLSCPLLGEGLVKCESELERSRSALGMVPPSVSEQSMDSAPHSREPSDSDDQSRRRNVKSALRRPGTTDSDRRANSERPRRRRHSRSRQSSGGQKPSTDAEVGKSNSAPGMTSSGLSHPASSSSGSEKGSIRLRSQSHRSRTPSISISGKKAAGTLTSGDESEHDSIDALSSLTIASFGRVHRKRLLREVAVLFAGLDEEVIGIVLDSFYNAESDVFDLSSAFDWFLRRGWGVDCTEDVDGIDLTTTGKTLHVFKLGILKLIQDDHGHNNSRKSYSLRIRKRNNTSSSPVPARHISNSGEFFR